MNEYLGFGAVVIAVAGQWPREVRRFTERHGIAFPLLIDTNRKVIKSYGVYHWLGLDAYNIARPSTFVIDKGGIVRYIHVGSHQFDLPKHASLIACVESLE